MVFVETEQSLLVCCSSDKNRDVPVNKEQLYCVVNNVRWTVFISSVTGVVDYENLSGKLE
jgi:hypothetical protein